MTQERTDFVAKSATGTIIRTFESRDMAMSWAEVDGHLFPGYAIACRTQTVLVRERVLRRDRSHLSEVAA